MKKYQFYDGVPKNFFWQPILKKFHFGTRCRKIFSFEIIFCVSRTVFSFKKLQIFVIINIHNEPWVPVRIVLMKNLILFISFSTWPEVENETNHFPIKIFTILAKKLRLLCLFLIIFKSYHKVCVMKFKL